MRIECYMNWKRENLWVKSKSLFHLILTTFRHSVPDKNIRGQAPSGIQILSFLLAPFDKGGYGGFLIVE